MKLRGALGGLNLLIEATDTRTTVLDALAARREMLAQKVTLELAADADPEALEAAFAAVREAGGELARVKGQRRSETDAPDAPRSPAAASVPAARPAQDAEGARTEIVQHNLRAGFRGEYRGSVVVLGDVNPGAELVAAGDVIVMGALRGVVHAGAAGRTDAIVYARPIASAQIRIAGAVARSADSSGLGAMRRTQDRPEAELARLQDGAILIESFHTQRG
ncbi:septum site-determining protein MinC [Deinococcus aquiradiocola]|uniref:Probable septum site-determining protein MinC n=1 Tax=Deinococcus aquiradiocola TaxID=393059 RepID=A0A917ULH6_9DEIO|nr:septum site-determining protein MinC [Deinococcus aquiradiocola]GGJ65728.1 putative septum site-determining protein MinC [Deinococcus aquiradiocola]